MEDNRRTLLNAVIKNVEGRAWQVPARDDEGRVVRENGDRAKLEEATVSTMIRTIIFSIPLPIQTPNDPFRVAQCFNQLENSPEDQVVLKLKTYSWLHKLLNRSLPQNKEEKEQGLSVVSYAHAIWGVNSWVILQQLLIPEERKSLDEDND